MNQIETQVVKIQLGDNKQASSFVYTLAESIEESNTELYFVCEMPMFNPAAASECQKIADSIVGSLRRSYSKAKDSNVFENALANVNEELGKLVNLGKTHWLGKLNAIIATKQNDVLSISSVGKTSALLYRDDQFVSISEGSTSSHQLKTFENFSEGKLHLSDILVLSTSQLFNHISVDRIKKLLKKEELPVVAETIINLLQDDLGPEAACATIFAAQVEASEIIDEEVELHSFLEGKRSQETGYKDKIKSFIPQNTKNTMATTAKILSNFWQDFYKKYLRPSYWRSVVDNSGKSLKMVQSRLSSTAKKVSPQNITGTIGSYSKQKKIFFASALVLLIALVTNVALNRVKTSNQQQVNSYNEQIANIEKLLNDSNAALLYNNESQAAEVYAQAKQNINLDESKLNPEQLSKYQSLKKQSEEIANKINKVNSAQVSVLGNLGNSGNLIALPNYFATETGRTILSYNRESKKIEDNVLKISEPVVASVQTNNTTVIYNGSAFMFWSANTGQISSRLTSESIPSRENFGGLTTYTNNKVYFIDKSSGSVKNTSALNKDGFGSITTSFTDGRLKFANSIAIDSNIYFISQGKIFKFNAGKEQTFNTPLKNLTDSSKISTTANAKYLYVLNPAAKQIFILNKDGSLNKSLSSDKFSDLKDFYIDEKNSTIYVLNGTELLSVKF